MYSALFVIGCFLFGMATGVGLGIYVERFRWNRLIEECRLPKPKREK